MNSTGVQFLANSPRSTQCRMQRRFDSPLILILHQREVHTHRLRLVVVVSHVAINSAEKNSG
jgi:hypothetical protein